MGALIIVLGVIWFLCKVLPEKRFDNYMPPEGYRVDHGAAMNDMTLNNLSKEEVMRNTVNGKYNVKK